MLFSTIGQIHIFTWMIGAGLMIGAWYALLAGARRLMQAGFWLSLLCDVIFGMGAAGIFILFLYRGNYGVPRLYCVLAVFAGLSLFALAPAPLIKSFCRGCGRILCRIFCGIKRIRWIKVIFK